MGDDHDGETVVVMRRLEDTDQLSHRIVVRDPTLKDAVREIARRLAVFHAECRIHADDDSPGTWNAVHEAWHRECDEIDRLGDEVADLADRATIRRLGVSYLDGRKPLFDQRQRSGQVRDGHGDLSCDHVFLEDGGATIIDSLELTPQRRIADVLSDLASLAMDLERLGADDLAELLVAGYREFSGETNPSSLLHFFIASRALVRAQADAIRAPHTGASTGDRTQLIEMAIAHLRRAVPVMVCVGGLPGAGKSTVSESFARVSGAVHLSSDEIRHGLTAAMPSSQASTNWEVGAYQPATTQAVYAELIDRAKTALGDGCSVVLDASWRDITHREQARAAADAQASVLVDVCCEVAVNVAARRLARTRDGYSPAGVRTRQRMTGSFAPWPTAHVVHTDGEIDVTVSDVRRLVDEASCDWFAAVPT